MNYYIGHPRVIIAALRGGAGKTLLSIGLCSLLGKRGYEIVPFKKGPDYIDASWLSMAAGRPCHHLDPYLMDWDTLLGSFQRHICPHDGAVIEGNRGIFDGLDAQGSCSTAELAKRLGAPVILVVDVTKMTRTTAALVRGVRAFDPDVDVKGVVLNQVANPRHEDVIRKSVEFNEGVPVLGAIPRIKGLGLRERHLGLIPPQEQVQFRAELLDMVAELVEGHVDVDAIWKKASTDARPLLVSMDGKSKVKEGGQTPFTLGVIRDEAFHFYYEENLEALVNSGAAVVEVDALRDRTLPSVDALYMGGGFPEVYAGDLADNISMREQIKKVAEDGLPIYAECGGLMYLGKAIRVNDRDYPMVGALPLVTEFLQTPQGHGYSELEVCGANPYFPMGYVIKGHEFHYSRLVSLDEDAVDFAFRVRRGNGIRGGKDGIIRRNILATYTHVHALGCDIWADGIARCARERQRGSVLQARVCV